MPRRQRDGTQPWRERHNTEHGTQHGHRGGRGRSTNNLVQNESVEPRRQRRGNQRWRESHNREHSSGHGRTRAPQGGFRRPRHHGHRGSRHIQVREQSRTDNSETDSGSNQTLDIPGFYYDESKKKYFKILPGQCNIQGAVTKESIEIKRAEQRRQQDLADIGKNIASSFLQDNDASSLHPRCILLSPKFTDNVYKIVDRMKCSYFTEKHKNSSQSIGLSVMHIVSRLKPSGRLKIFENPGTSYEKLEHMLRMEVNEEQDKILCLWALKEQIVQRIQMLNINGINKFDDDGSIEIDILPTGAVLFQSFSKVTDMCWAPLDGADPLDCCILYTTTCFLGNNPSLALLRRLDADSSQGFRHTEFNLGQKATWACAWDGTRNQLSVGSEECALLLDVTTRRMWELHTGNSDARSQVFQKGHAPMLFSGTKKGIIYGHDLRTVSSSPAMRLKQKSCVCQMQFPRDTNYLFAADFSGKIKQWDIRQRKVLVEFQGHNEYSRTPFHIDPTETIISSAGQDCYTRLWDIRNGRLLKSIPPPHPACRETIPPSHLFSLPCRSVRQPGLLMGSHDELHFYSHH